MASPPLPLAACLVVGLLSAQAACSFRSLDHLQNGPSRDSGLADHKGGAKEDASKAVEALPDLLRPDGTAPDAGGGEVLRQDVGAPDSLGLDSHHPDSLNRIDVRSDVPGPKDAPSVDSSIEAPHPSRDAVADSLQDAAIPDSPSDNPASAPDVSNTSPDTSFSSSDSPVFAPDVSDVDPDTSSPPSDAPADNAPTDLGIASPDSSIDLAPDLRADLTPDGATDYSAQIYTTASATSVGATYAKSMDLGSEPDRLITVALAWDSSAVGNPSITYAGEAMTLAEKAAFNGQALAIYYRVGPPTGVGDLSVSFASSVNLSVVILGLRHVNPNSPVSPGGTTSANWAMLSSGASAIYDGSLALVHHVSTTGNNEAPSVTGAPYGAYQTVQGRPTSPYLSVGAGICPTAGAYSWTFSYDTEHWQGITVLMIRSRLP